MISTDSQAYKGFTNGLRDTEPAVLAVLAKVVAFTAVPNFVRVCDNSVEQYDEKIGNCDTKSSSSLGSCFDSCQQDLLSSICTSGQRAIPLPTTPACFLPNEALMRVGI